MGRPGPGTLTEELWESLSTRPGASDGDLPGNLPGKQMGGINLSDLKGDGDVRRVTQWGSRCRVTRWGPDLPGKQMGELAG